MPTFGAFEGVRKVRDRGLVTAWSARAADAKSTSTPAFLVTVGGRLPWSTGDSEFVAAERFLEAAELQRRVADGSSFWARVIDSGHAAEGPFTVTPYYPRTVGDLIEGQMAMTGRRLYRIVRAVLQGLADLHESEGRAHGALEPDSILIGKGELARAPVVLSSPAASHAIDEQSAGADMRTLGDTIHQLMMHRPFRLTAGLPLRPSEEWDRLGRNGDGWRLFCSKLLDPRPENTLALEDALGELRRLREDGWRRRAIAGAVLAAVVVCGVIAFPVVRGLFTTGPVAETPDEAEWDAERWARLCTEYNDWFAAFSDGLTPKRRARWAKDPHLSELLARLGEADTVVDPRKIAGTRGLIRAMAKRPPKGARTPEAVAKTIAALELVDLVAARQTLTASTWPALGQVDALADVWDRRGWRREAAFLRELVVSVRPGPNLHTQIDHVLELKSSGALDGIEARWASLEKAGKTLADSGDPILATFLPHVRDATRSEEGQGGRQDIDALLAELDKLAALGKQLTTFTEGAWRSEVDREAFTSESAIHRNFDGTASRHTFVSWLEAVQLYRAIPFDVAARQQQWDNVLAEVEADVKRVEERSHGGARVEAASWAKMFRADRTAAVVSEIQKLQAIPRIRKNKASLEGAVAEVDRKLMTLREEARSAVLRFVIPEDPQKWLDAVRAIEFSSSKALDAAWQARRAGLLANVTAEGLRGTANQEKYVDIRDRVTRLQSTLARLDDEAALPRALPESAAAHKGRPWFALLARRVAAQREQAVAACLARLSWDDGVPRPIDESVRSDWQKTFKAFADWRAEAGRLAMTLGTLERALDNCMQLDETPPGAAGTLAELFAVWEKRTILENDAELESAAGAVVRRVSALKSIASLTDRSELSDRAIAALAARQPGAALAAWRRLRTLDPPWPDAEDEFKQDAEFEARLTSMLVALDDTERSRVLREQVGRDGLARRVRALERLAGPVTDAGDAVLARLGPLVAACKQAVSDKPLKDAVSEVEAMARLARRLADRVAGDWQTDRIDRELFVAEGAVYRAEAKAPSQEVLELWLREADDYVRLDPDDAVAKARAALVAREKALRQAIAGAPEESRKPLLDRLEERVAPVTSLSAVRKNRDALARAAPDAEKALTELGAGLELETRIGRLEYELRKGAADLARESGDKTLARLGEHVEAEIEAASAQQPKERVQALEALAQFVAELATFVRGDWHEKIDRRAFAAATRPAEGKPTRETFLDWMKRARAFQYLDAEDDPRGKPAAWAARRTKLDAAIEELARHGDLGRETAGAWQTRLEREVWPGVEALLGVSWIAQNRSAVAEQLKAVNSQLASVEGVVRAQEAWFRERDGLERDLAELVGYGEAEKEKAAALRARLATEGWAKIRPALEASWSAETLPGLVAQIEDGTASLRGIRREAAGLLEKPGDFLARARKAALDSPSAALQAGWTRWRDGIVQRQTAAALEGDRGLYARVRTRFGELPGFLRGLDDPQSLPPGLPQGDLPEATRAAAARAVAAAREKTLAGAVEAVPLGADGFPSITLLAFNQTEAWRQFCREYVAARDGVATVLTGAAAIEQMLAAGHLPDDTPEGAESLRARFTVWDRARAAQPEAIRAPFDPLAARMQAILAVEKLDRAALARRAAKPDGDIQIAMIAWKLLGAADDWPGSADELRTEAALRQRLGAFAQAHDTVPWLAPALAKDATARWERGFHAVARAAVGAEGDRQVEAALDLAPAFGIEDFDKTSVDTRLRRELFLFRSRAAKLPAGAKKDVVVPEVERFARAVRALPGGVASRPAVADLLGALEGLKNAEETPQNVGLKRAGPVAGGAGTWAAGVEGDGRVITYQWIGTRHALTFLRVAGGNGKPFYLCTTEMSVGLFVDVVRTVDAWSDVRSLLTRYDPRYPDPRRGPRSWRYRGEEVSVERDWLTRDPTVPDPYRTPPPAPRTTHPMQYVSPEAALFVARRLGCRLPTAAEWRAAFKADGGANLRDAAWLDHKKYIAEVRAEKPRARVQWPDAGIFVPPDLTVRRRADAEPVATDNDGILWFAPVGSGSTLQHMTGNVAEFVLDAAEAFDQKFAAPASATPSALRAFVDDAREQLKVIGGSALSPPELWNGADRPFQRSLPVSLSSARIGFSDVGFRLAFTSPADPLVAQLQRILDKHAYLP